MELFGVRLVGIGDGVGTKVLLTLALALAVVVVRALVAAVAHALARRHEEERAERVRFWTNQSSSLAALALFVVGGVAIWFDDAGRLASVAGLVSAGIAVALQRVLTSFAAYLIILRGRVFTVGDRITMAGVRGDVVALGFMQTSVMEMGEPPGDASGGAGGWVAARQYTGRIVRLTNDKIFDSPVYNYTREFPYVWEELRLPVRYQDDRARVERILLDAARQHTAPIVREAEAALVHLRRAYFLAGGAGLEPVVDWRLTAHGLALALRCGARAHGVRGLKDAMSRDILAALDAAGIGLASATYDIVGFPPIRIERDGRDEARPEAAG